MGQFIENLQRNVLKITGLTYTDSEWDSLQGKGKNIEPNTCIEDSTFVEKNFMRDSALQYYLMKNTKELELQQTFANSNKTVSIVIMSKLQSGSLDQKVLNDPAAVGFLYFLQLGKSSNKPMYISIPELALKLQTGEWVEETGVLEALI